MGERGLVAYGKILGLYFRVALFRGALQGQGEWKRGRSWLAFKSSARGPRTEGFQDQGICRHFGKMARASGRNRSRWWEKKVGRAVQGGGLASPFLRGTIKNFCSLACRKKVTTAEGASRSRSFPSGKNGPFLVVGGGQGKDTIKIECE